MFVCRCFGGGSSSLHGFCAPFQGRVAVGLDGNLPIGFIKFRHLQYGRASRVACSNPAALASLELILSVRCVWISELSGRSRNSET